MEAVYRCGDCSHEITSIEYEELDNIFCPECSGHFEKIDDEIKTVPDSTNKIQDKQLLITCDACKHKFSRRATKCPKCEWVPTAICEICKSKIPLDSKSCPECGDPAPFPSQPDSKPEVSSTVKHQHHDEILERKEKERVVAENESQKKSSINLWLFFVVAIIILGYFGKNNVPKTTTNRNQSQYSSVNYNLSYGSIQNNADSMTDAQFDEYEKTIIGQYVSWSGKLSDVDQNITNTDYEVKIDMDGNAYDVQFDVNKSTALNLRKRQQYSFKGEIKRATKVLGAVVVTLRNVQIN
jgi:hypothetical protein